MEHKVDAYQGTMEFTGNMDVVKPISVRGGQM